MSINRDQDQKHLKHPMPGDVWQEMLSLICVIIDFDGEIVTLCKKKKEVGYYTWTWDLEKLERIRVEEFANWLTYDTIPDKTWCNVMPGAHKWVVEKVLHQDFEVLIKG